MISTASKFIFMCWSRDEKKSDTRLRSCLNLKNFLIDARLQGVNRIKHSTYFKNAFDIRDVLCSLFACKRSKFCDFFFFSAKRWQENRFSTNSFLCIKTAWSCCGEKKHHGKGNSKSHAASIQFFFWENCINDAK